jgi:DNA-binding transcriptional MerR regulator
MPAKTIVQKTSRPRTIGRLAKEAGVHVETIRFYERCGLLRRPPSPPSGWRTYDDSAVWIIHYIKLGRQLGFTLAELRKLLTRVGSGKRFCISVQAAYENKIHFLDQKIVQMKSMRRELQSALSACIKRSVTGDCPIASRCFSQQMIPISKIVRRRPL